MGKAVALVYPTHGHITPSLAVVHELVRRGEEVVFYATPRARAQVERTGAAFRAYEASDTDFNPDPPTDGLLADMSRLLALTERTLPRLLAEIRSEAPDYILIDTKSVWGRLAAQALGSARHHDVRGLRPDARSHRRARSRPHALRRRLTRYVAERASWISSATPRPRAALPRATASPRPI